MFLLTASTHLASESDIPDVQRALTELGKVKPQPRSGPYWAKIRARLLEASASSEVVEAIQEWHLKETWQHEDGVCELCDKAPIFYHFRIANRVTRKTFVVGCECVHQYLQIVDGVPDIREERRRLEAILTKLKAIKTERGTHEELVQLREAQDLDRALVKTIQDFAKPDQDVDIQALIGLLEEPYRVGQNLRLHSSTFKSVATALVGLRNLYKKTQQIRRRSKIYDGKGLLGAVQTIMRYPAIPDKLESLADFKDAMVSAFQLGSPKALVTRVWDEVNAGRDAFLSQLRGEADSAEQSCEALYKRDLEVLKPFEHLYFLLRQGVDANKAQINNQLQRAETIIKGPRFIEELTSGSLQTLPSFNAQLSLTDGALEATAFRVHEFTDSVIRSQDVLRLAKALSVRYEIRIQDIAGVRKALFLCGDDGLVDVDSLGASVIDHVIKSLASDVKLEDVFRSEVQDLHSANPKVYVMISRQWGLDIQKLFKRLSARDPNDKSFAKGLITKIWGNGLKPNTRQLSFAQQCLGRQEVSPNMWDAMSDELDTIYKPEAM